MMLWPRIAIWPISPGGSGSPGRSGDLHLGAGDRPAGGAGPGRAIAAVEGRDRRGLAQPVGLVQRAPRAGLECMQHLRRQRRAAA